MGSLRVWLSYHPPSHILERDSVYNTLCSGGKVGFYRGSMEHVCINNNCFIHTHTSRCLHCCAAEKISQLNANALWKRT